MEKRKRPVRLGVYFTEDEFAVLRKKSKEAGLSMGDYIRRLVADKEIKQAPSADIPILIRDIRCVGTNVNQLLKQVNTTHLLDAPQMRKVLAEAWLAEKAIVDAFALED